jgi:spore coat polysaccharide biosynthesis predicted glycosyltransferase SpsG
LVDPKYYHIGLGKIREKVEQLMISFGLHDTANATSKALLAIKKLEERKLFRPKSILVYLGSQAPHKEDVRYHLQLFGGRAKLVLDSGNILAGLKDCDLAIGGGGVGMFERASAGVPSLTFTIADNQIPNASGAHSAKITMYAGDIRCLSLTQLESAILQMVKNTHLRRVIALSGPQLIDGKGAFRLAGALHRLARGSNMSRPGMT